MSLGTVLSLVGGLVLLVAGAELLVRGAARLAVALGVAPLVIGLTVVAYGTSAPELAVSVQAAWTGQADISLGNVVGSNIANVLLILGLSALVAPLAVALQLIRFDVVVMILVSMLVPALAWEGELGRLDGALLVCGGMGYTAWLVRQSRKAPQPQATAGPDGPTARAGAAPLVGNAVLALIGLGLLVLGARWLVAGATTLARSLGVSELIIGLTIVAVGTSLPELATSVVASLRGQRDIAVGNVVGSNIFNILIVLGGAALIGPQGVAVSRTAFAFDIPVMIAVALACLPVFFTGYRIDRWEGLLFLAYYAAYVAYLVLDATRSAALGWYRTGLLGFAVPLTALTLTIVTLRAWRRPTRTAEGE